MLTCPEERSSTPSRSVTKSWNGPDRAGFVFDLRVALLSAAEARALGLVFWRLIHTFSPDMVATSGLKPAIKNHSRSYKLKHLRRTLVRHRSAEQSTDDGRLAQGSTKVLGCEVSQGAAKWPSRCSCSRRSRQEVVSGSACAAEVSSKHAL